MIASYTDRRFQLWEYRVGHGSLLIRSPKSSEAAFNLDIVFVGVEYFALPRMFNGVAVDRGNEDDRTEVNVKVGSVDAQRLFVVLSGGRRYHVVAVACRISENEDDIFDSPF